jgi:small-conductance mechanosensitive channel
MDLQKLVSEDLGSLFASDNLEKLLVAAVTVVGGILLLRVLTALVGRLARARMNPQSAMLARKAVFYLGVALVFIVVLRELGIQPTALLGAAGIVGIAIGFASQTSVSNVISGLFLVSEKPFALGDVIKAGGQTGIVMSIDLLSVKIRTFDNQYIRIPNENILSTELTNVTYFPIRRMDFTLSISYRNALEKAREVLLGVADRNTLCLREPAPVVVFTGFADSGQEILFGVWFAKADYVQVRNSLMVEIKRSFDAEGIEIPFPHRTIAGGLAADPLPVRVVEPEGPARPTSKRRRG